MWSWSLQSGTHFSSSEGIRTDDYWEANPMSFHPLGALIILFVWGKNHGILVVFTRFGSGGWLMVWEGMPLIANITGGVD